MQDLLRISKQLFNYSKALEEIKQFEESKDSIASNPGLAKKLAMAGSKLPTIFSGGDDDSKSQN